MTTSDAIPGKSADDVLRDALKSQYHAALRMLRLAVELCPDDLWFRHPEDERPFWLTAYHALFYTHLYLDRPDRSLDSSELHQSGIQNIEDVPSPPTLDEEPEPPKWPPVARTPMERSEVLEYWDECDSIVDGAMDALEMLGGDDGLHWDNPPLPHLLQQVDAIRHLQHHTSQLCTHLQFVHGTSVEWVGACRPTVVDALERL